jgi:hypothetical protein
MRNESKGIATVFKATLVLKRFNNVPVYAVSDPIGQIDGEWRYNIQQNVFSS